ncbi:MAG: chemotaxis protein CheW [Sterolibacterium sp.]
MTAYLLLSLNGAHYGVAAKAVQEIAWLPDLSPAEEAPRYVAGMVNLRGKIEPVMDLGLRLGHPPRPYRLSDSIVMLQADGATMGVIVSEVSNVVGIAAAEIEAPPHYAEQPSELASFLLGNAKVGEDIVMLLNVPRLLHAPAPPEPGVCANPQASFCPDATDEERAVFRARAHNLMQTAGSLEAAATIPLAIVQLGEEYFGVELDAVREFAHLRRATEIPCCPPHIAGNMNLRGDILTLVDIRGLLNIPAASPATQVMVVESGELSLGVPVDQVLEVIYLRPADFAALPAAAHTEKNEYCKGVVRYGERMVCVLDLRKILAEGGLEVEETV